MLHEGGRRPGPFGHDSTIKLACSSCVTQSAYRSLKAKTLFSSMIQSIERFTLSKLRGFGEAGELLTAHRLDCSLVEKWRFSDVLSFGCFCQL
jgi:hypothetical protein